MPDKLQRLDIRAPKPAYTIQIDEIVEGENPDGDFCLVQCDLHASGDEVAAAIMSDLLLAVAKHSDLSTDRLNANMYKTQWINGI